MPKEPTGNEVEPTAHGGSRPPDGPVDAGGQFDAADLARIIKANFDVLIEIDTETEGEVHTGRTRPLNEARVRALLDRLRHDLATDVDEVVVVGDRFHLVLRPRRANEPSPKTFDVVNLISVPELDPTPQAAVANAARLVLFRQQLLETGAVDYAALAKGRRTSVDAARKFVQRAVARHQLISVRYNEKVYVPVFLLDEAFEPDPTFEPVLQLLHDARESGWSAWTFLATPSSWLSGRVPAEAIRVDPDAVFRATARRVSNRAA